MVAHAPQRIGSFVEIFKFVACLLEFDAVDFAAIGATQQVLNLPCCLVGLALPLVGDVMEAVDDTPCQALRGGFQARVP